MLLSKTKALLCVVSRALTLGPVYLDDNDNTVLSWLSRRGKEEGGKNYDSGLVSTCQMVKKSARRQILCAQE